MIAFACPAVYQWNQRTRGWAKVKQIYKPNPVPIEPEGFLGSGHSSSPEVTFRVEHPTRMSNGAGHASIPIWICSVWGLPGLPIARQPVRSCRTISPLPRRDCRLAIAAWRLRVSESNKPRFNRQSKNGQSTIPSGRYLFCCTFRALSSPPRYGAHYPVEFGLSSRPTRSGSGQRPLDLLPEHYRQSHSKYHDNFWTPPKVERLLPARSNDRSGMHCCALYFLRY